MPKVGVISLNFHLRFLVEFLIFFFKDYALEYLNLAGTPN
jgi:hypothetical protein